MAHQEEPRTLAEFFYGSVRVGERGQIVIPAEARKAHGVRPGDKLLVFRHPYIRGLMLARVDDVRAMWDELQQWQAFVARLADEAGQETESE